MLPLFKMGDKCNLFDIIFSISMYLLSGRVSTKLKLFLKKMQYLRTKFCHILTTYSCRDGSFVKYLCHQSNSILVTESFNDIIGKSDTIKIHFFRYNYKKLQMYFLFFAFFPPFANPIWERLKNVFAYVSLILNQCSCDY